jgi:hypothetical protein
MCCFAMVDALEYGVCEVDADLWASRIRKMLS